MKSKNILSALVISAIVSAGCFAEDTSKVDLKLRLKTGESHEMKMTETQDAAVTTNGKEQKVKSSQETVMGLNVLSVDASGNMDVELVCRSIKMKVNGTTGNFEFDSANPKPVDSNRPDQRISAALFSAMVGSKIQMKLKPTGELYDIRGLDAILAKIKEKIPEARKEGSDFYNLFSDENVKKMTGNMLGVFPAGPVAVGDNWHKTMNMNLGPFMPTDVNTTYTLKQCKDGIAYIDAAAKFSTIDSSKTSVVHSNNRTSEQSAGTIKSSMEINEATGLTHRSNTTMNLSSETKMAANQRMPQGMKILMTIQGNEVVELIK